MAKSTLNVVTGVAHIDRAFKELPLRLQKKALRPAIRHGAKLIQQDAKKYAARQSGRLRKSIKVRSLKRSRVRIGSGISAGSEFTAGDLLPWYAKFIEFGTKPRQTKSGANRGRIEKTSFLRRAMNENREKVRLRFIASLSAQIRKLNVPFKRERIL